LLIGWKLVVVLVVVVVSVVLEGWEVVTTLGVIAVRLVMSSGRLFVNVLIGRKYMTWL
jgi:hypothetical protein